MGTQDTTLQTLKAAQYQPESLSLQKNKRLHLTEAEARALITKAGKTGRYPKRDKLILTMMYQHGLRACELCDLQWSDVDFTAGTIFVRRAKNGISSSHPLSASVMRGLRAHQRENDSRWIFVTERGSPLSTRNLRRIISTIGAKTSIPPHLHHPHALRHACGFKLINQGMDVRTLQVYLGHSNIAHTAKYSALNEKAFRNYWN